MEHHGVNIRKRSQLLEEVNNRLIVLGNAFQLDEPVSLPLFFAFFVIRNKQKWNLLFHDFFHIHLLYGFQPDAFRNRPAHVLQKFRGVRLARPQLIDASDDFPVFLFLGFHLLDDVIVRRGGGHLGFQFGQIASQASDQDVLEYPDHEAQEGGNRNPHGHPGQVLLDADIADECFIIV